MTEKANDDAFKQLCELAARERDGEKLMALTNEIIALLDAQQGKPNALPQPKK